MKTRNFGLTLALAALMSSKSPTFATDQFHPTAIPTTCIGCDEGSASAKWANDPNHFHLDLNLRVIGCPVSVTPAVVGSNQTQDEGLNFAGALVHPAAAHPAESFAFDFKVLTCETSNTYFFVDVEGSDGFFYIVKCKDFPVSNNGGWTHESFERSTLGIPNGVKIKNIYIGLYSAINTLNTAQVRNITVNGIPSIDVTEPAQTFCPGFDEVVI